MITDKRIMEITGDYVALACVPHFETVYTAIHIALAESEPLIRKDEREKVADWIESGDWIGVTPTAFAKQLRGKP